MTTLTNKALCAIKSRTVRGLIDLANQEGIQKEDIVEMLSENGFYTLVYYG